MGKILAKQEMATCGCNKPAKCRGLCANCYAKWLLKNNPEFAERQRENCRKWIREHQEECKAKSKEWRAKQDKTYINNKNMLKRSGVSIEKYEEMLKIQNGGCAICGRPPKEGKRLAIDHCHKTGAVRGLLCFRCNFGLSFFKDDRDALMKAIDHLDGKSPSAKLVEDLKPVKARMDKSKPITFSR
jgi:hypothetical protein